MPPRCFISHLRTVARAGSIHRSSIHPSACPHTVLQFPKQPSQIVRTYSTKRKEYGPSTEYDFRNPLRLGAIVFTLALSYRAYEYYFLSPANTQYLDAPPSNPSERHNSGAKVDLTVQGHSSDAIERIPTGSSKVPFFPKKIWLPRSDAAKDSTVSAALPAGTGALQDEEEYQLMGLGMRTVSFLSIQVYLVGIYVAKRDMGRLQEELVRAYMPGGSNASTLVQGEKEDLKKMLLDGTGSETIWTQVLKDGGVSSAVRIVPMRDTNFDHLRDGWLRGISSRGKGVDFEGPEYQSALADFKRLMSGKGSVGKGKVLLLSRGTEGHLRAWVEDGVARKAGAEQQNLGLKMDGMSFLGTVRDERISRLVWMGYLAGKNVASEAARQSVIDGVMDVVERPIGTVETQVV